MLAARRDDKKDGRWDLWLQALVVVLDGIEDDGEVSSLAPAAFIWKDSIAGIQEGSFDSYPHLWVGKIVTAGNFL